MSETVTDWVHHTHVFDGADVVTACGAARIERPDTTIRHIPCPACAVLTEQREAALRPVFEKVIGQYQRGLITSGELVTELDNIYQGV